MHKKILAICAALVAFAALPAMASASPHLTETGGVAVKVGSIIKATNTGNTVMTTSFGNIECTSATLTGSVIKNSGTEIEGEISKATFTGTGAGGTCTTSFLGNITVTPKKLPWCIKAGGKLAADTFELVGAKCGSTGSMEFTLDSSTVGECTYIKTAVNGTFTTGEKGDLTVSQQSFTKSAGSGFCPSSGSLDMTFDLYTEVEGKEGPHIFIT